MDLLFLEQLKIKQEMQTEWESGMMADSKGPKVGTEPSAAAQTHSVHGHTLSHLSYWGVPKTCISKCNYTFSAAYHNICSQSGHLIIHIISKGAASPVQQYRFGLNEPPETFSTAGCKTEAEDFVFNTESISAYLHVFLKHLNWLIDFAFFVFFPQSVTFDVIASHEKRSENEFAHPGVMCLSLKAKARLYWVFILQVWQWCLPYLHQSKCVK